MVQGTSTLPITRVKDSRRESVDFDNLPFGTIWSDHMFVADYADGAWSRGKIQPYGPIEIHPSAKALQYAVSGFEGFKAHKMPTGECAVFRPEMNRNRLNRTAQRLMMPEVPEELFFDAMRELLEVDKDWLPDADQGALYIRPSYFGITPTLTVAPGDAFRLVIMTCPVGGYFSDDISLTITREYVRAFPGGTGSNKLAGNYAPTMLASALAQKQGYHNVVWLDGVEKRYIEECGVMNVFFVIDGIVVTPPLEGTILPGVNRDSAIHLLADLGIPCEERRVSVDELREAAAAGILEEMFGCGTAAAIAPVGRLGLEDEDITLELESDSIANRLKAELFGIQTGTIEDRHGWLMRL